MNTPKVIAFYLPQYHPTSDNDKWWGKGFTEWTNVAKAKPLFKGHEQPKIPADLGFYDLRLPETREAQAAMARNYGIDGFCYYHYWFGNGKQELERPFEEVLQSGKPDFPFMLCWANETWSARFWNKDGSKENRKTLVEQTYPQGDIEKHFAYLKPAFKDSRYIKIDGKPVFMIYNPFDLPDLKNYMEAWQNEAKRNGMEGIFFIGQLHRDITSDKINFLLENGFEAINTCRLFDVWFKKRTPLQRMKRIFNRLVRDVPGMMEYSKLINHFIQSDEQNDRVLPTMVPNWDHTPRSGATGTVLIGATPSAFRNHAEEIMKCAAEKTHPIAFLKSWNEWGEGNYMEPDLIHGHQFLQAFLNAKNSISS